MLVCPFCNKPVAETFSGLKKHVRAMHAFTFTKCPVCGKKVRFITQHCMHHSDESHRVLYALVRDANNKRTKLMREARELAQRVLEEDNFEEWKKDKEWLNGSADKTKIEKVI